ncbi:TIGR03085 family metal-binding protein [Mycolicibacterium sphagni]|uniref:TIGR03085 family protein n=1 Tax=Mycolicibacterium sphagni TaxID=1786 RepID=A0ABX2JTH4_9MYCO|nr:TIGR03085 family metal-binding protein [Mycolicibacterium sphagni]NTY60109.1 TIGR03085 family protein [Mycolicibacterium sphagni]
MSIVQRERAAMVAAFRAVGPDAPTLCGGWTTRDLTAHLLVRERRPDAMPGILFAPLAPYTARVQNKLTASTKWDDPVELFATGPPLLSAFKFLDPVASIHEMFVHHEDVRRAQTGWEPRELDAKTTAAIKRRIPVVSRAALSKAMAAVPARLTLRTPDGQTVTTVGHGSPVTVTGEPLELLLFAFGRNAVRVDFDGDDEVISAVLAAERGF